MNLLRLSVFSSLAAIGFLACGCSGYKLGSIKPSAMSHVETLAIPTFKNDTLRPRVQVLTTNEVIKQLQRDGTYQIADPARGGDAILHGTITNVERRQLRGSRTDVLRTTEIEIKVIIDFVLEDAESGAELDHGTVTGRTSVYLDPNFQLSERQAVQLAAENAAKSLASRISEGY